MYAVRWQALRAENWADNMQSNGGKEPQRQQIVLLQAKQKSRKLPAIQVKPVLLWIGIHENIMKPLAAHAVEDE